MNLRHVVNPIFPLSATFYSFTLNLHLNFLKIENPVKKTKYNTVWPWLQLFNMNASRPINIFFCKFDSFHKTTNNQADIKSDIIMHTPREPR